MKPLVAEIYLLLTTKQKEKHKCKNFRTAGILVCHDVRCDICQDEVEQVKIIPSIKSDHSAITLLFNGIEEQRHGPSHWKFNSNLTKDEEYIKLITDSVPVWIEEFKDINDKRVLWDLIKYRIRQVSMRYSKEKARLRKMKILEIEKSLTFY